MVDYLIIGAHVHTCQTREIGLQAKQGSNITDYASTRNDLVQFSESKFYACLESDLIVAR